jgi:hypothetical protein
VQTLASEKEVRRLLEQRPKTTQTYRVPPEVVGRVPIDKKVRLRSLEDDEIKELAEYLEVGVEELDGPFSVVEASCPNCSRQITFLDFVQTAVDKGVHERAELREILTGRAGAWITIRGRDGGRPVSCAGCGATARMPNAYSEYSSSSYAYA